MLTAIDPTSGTPLHEYPAIDPHEMETRIVQAAQAYTAWRAASFAERGEVLRNAARLLRENRDRHAHWMTAEMGKPIREARGEVDKAAWCAEHYAEHAERYLAAHEIESDATHSRVQHPPLGPVLGILPWNAPYWLAFRFAAPALMAGNTALIKHDPHVPACAAALEQLFTEAGAPPGVFTNLALETPAVADAIRHPRIRAVSFTGSSAAGARVAGTAAAALKPTVLELGGSDPAIVLADADLDSAVAAIALMRVINAGQSCIAAKRIIVADEIHDAFVERLHARLAALTVGDPRAERTDVGPLARADLRDNLARQVDATVAAGAKCLLGGTVPDGPGFFYPVTLLSEVRNHMPACREETFGPVAAVLRAASPDEALAIANDTQYGLAASVWTADVARAEQIAARLDTGQVAINGLVKTDPRLPSGGVKQSGYGRELGPHGIHAFVNAQQIWIGPKRD